MSEIDEMPTLVNDLNNNRTPKSCNVYDSDSSGSECEYEDVDQDESDFVQRKVKGLFTEKIFENVKDMFAYESTTNNFNLIDVLTKFNMDMFAYIKMINYIRKNSPKPEVFTHEYPAESDYPWSDDKYMQTVLEDDCALQFDVEEDLDMLELEYDRVKHSAQKEENDLIRGFRNKLATSNAKVDELTEVVGKLRNLATGLLNTSKAPVRAAVTRSESESSNSEEDDSHYIRSYANYSIHMQMLQDKVRTEGYMNAILKNADAFKDKVVLDVGCGSGILSLFAAKAGAKLVIAVDMSDIIEHAIQIAKENGMSDKIVFLKGKMEEVKLPVEKVDIIISEWMGYFLVFESMLDSVLFARNKYLKPDGMVLPNFFEMHLFGVTDQETYDRTINFWTDVYGFKMPSLRRTVMNDAQIITIPEECVSTDSFLFKEIDCLNCSVEEVSKFESEFTLKVKADTFLTGIGASFETFFNDKQLVQFKSEFSTNCFSTTTHWQQTLFQFDKPVEVKKDELITGKIYCCKNPEYLRSYIVVVEMFGKTFKYKVE